MSTTLSNELTDKLIEMLQLLYPMRDYQLANNRDLVKSNFTAIRKPHPALIARYQQVVFCHIVLIGSCDDEALDLLQRLIELEDLANHNEW